MASSARNCNAARKHSSTPENSALKLRRGMPEAARIRGIVSAAYPSATSNFATAVRISVRSSDVGLYRPALTKLGSWIWRGGFWSPPPIEFGASSAVLCCDNREPIPLVRRRTAADPFVREPSSHSRERRVTPATNPLDDQRLHGYAIRSLGEAFSKHRFVGALGESYLFERSGACRICLDQGQMGIMRLPLELTGECAEGETQALLPITLTCL